MRVGRGMSLIECVIASLIVGVAAVAALSAASDAVKRRADATARGLAEALAAELAAEAARLPYEDPGGCTTLGPDTGELARSQFDDCDDLNGWNESEITLRDGAKADGLRGYTRAVTVAWAELDDPGKDSAVETGLKRITVVAAWNGTPMATAVAYRSRHWQEASE